MVEEPARLVVSADLANVARTRRFVRHVLADAPVEVSEDLQLAVSELVTNAIEHGGGDEIVVSVRIQAPRYEVAVTSNDGFADILPDSAWEVADAPARTGRGLGIVREVADEVQVRRAGERLTIRVVRRVGRASSSGRSLSG